MFHVKLVARPDTRMVEVPLEIEAELPREFDGAALLASSGLPRKVKIKAPKDALKLSTAYRADQLLADIVRTALRGSPQDVARVQEAARAFIKNVRERRRDGTMLLVQSNGRGKIDVIESVPTPLPRMAGAAAAPADGQPATGTLADRVGALERRLSQLETGFARLIGEDAHASLESRLLRLEAELGVEKARAQDRLSDAPEVAALPTPLAEPRGRTTLRRGTAVDAFAEGLRAELRSRATQQLGAADRAQQACDKAARLFAEAVRDLAAPPGAPEGEALQALANQAAARQRSLHRFVGEVDLYSAAELPIAERLLSRLQPPGDTGPLHPDPARPLQALGEKLLRAGFGSQLLAGWVEAAAPLCGWHLIEPREGQQLVPDLHESKEPSEAGATITRLLVPGARRSDDSIIARARVSTESADPGLAQSGEQQPLSPDEGLAPASTGSAPAAADPAARGQPAAVPSGTAYAEVASVAQAAAEDVVQSVVSESVAAESVLAESGAAALAAAAQAGAEAARAAAAADATRAAERVRFGDAPAAAVAESARAEASGSAPAEAAGAAALHAEEAPGAAPAEASGEVAAPAAAAPRPGAGFPDDAAESVQLLLPAHEPAKADAEAEALATTVAAAVKTVVSSDAGWSPGGPGPFESTGPEAPPDDVEVEEVEELVAAPLARPIDAHGDEHGQG